MSSITENMPINDADIDLREQLIRQGLICPINKEKELLELAKKRLFAIKERILRRQKIFEDFVQLQFEFIEDRLKSAYYLFEFERKTPANYFLLLVFQKLSQLEKFLAKDILLKKNPFVIYRTGFFFSFKENKKNTP